MPKESVTALKQQNQDLKDKADDLSKELTQLKEKVRVDSAITFGAEAAATSGNSNNTASNVTSDQAFFFFCFFLFLWLETGKK